MLCMRLACYKLNSCIRYVCIHLMLKNKLKIPYMRLVGRSSVHRSEVHKKAVNGQCRTWQETAETDPWSSAKSSPELENYGEKYTKKDKEGLKHGPKLSKDHANYVKMLQDNPKRGRLESTIEDVKQQLADTHNDKDSRTELDKFSALISTNEHKTWLKNKRDINRRIAISGIDSSITAISLFG